MKIRKVLTGKITGNHRSVANDENGQEIRESSFLQFDGVKEQTTLYPRSPILSLDGLYPVGAEFILTLEEK